MAIRHQVTDYDTVYSLSYQYFGDTQHVNDIINYNNLVSPYLSPNNDDRFLCYASGYVRVERELVSSRLVIKKHWTLRTKPNIISSARKTYVVTEDIVMDVGMRSTYLPVRSLVPGLQGNTLADSITTLGSEFERNFISFKSVTNPKPVRGGTEGKILTTGEYLYIPIDSQDTTTSEEGYNRAHYFFGEDLKLSTAYDLGVSDKGDLETVSFIANIAQSIRIRLESERGDSESIFEDGNDLATLIGTKDIPADVLPSRLEVEILRIMSFEDRVKDTIIKSINIDMASQVAYVDMQTTVVSLDEILDINNLAIRGNRSV